MKLIIDGFGKSVTKRDNQIVIKENGVEKDYFRAENISQILLTGKGSITFDALRLLAEYDIDCASLDWRGRINYRLTTPDNKNAIVKKEQYFSLMDKRSGYLSKSFILAKIENQKAILGTLAKSRENNEFLIEQRNKLNENRNKLLLLKDKKSDDVRSKIMGIEGYASSEYWRAIESIIDEKWDFHCRSGKGADDSINALLNYGYAILENDIWKAIYIAGLDPYCGFLHSERYGRASLVYDLIEEFRQQIVDKVVLSIVNRNQINPNYFEYNGNFLAINDKGRHILISEILNKLNSSIEFYGMNTKYTDIIMYQARLITKFLLGEKNYIGFSRRW